MAVAQLGELDERGCLEARALAARLIGTPEQAPLFADGTGDLTLPVRLKEIRIERPDIRLPVVPAASRPWLSLSRTGSFL